MTEYRFLAMFVGGLALTLFLLFTIAPATDHSDGIRISVAFVFGASLFSPRKEPIAFQRRPKFDRRVPAVVVRHRRG